MLVRSAFGQPDTINCVDCHGVEEQNGQLRLDRLASMLSGGNSGEPAVVPGDPKGSFLVKLIKHQEAELEMPPEDSLSEAEIKLIETWIAEGANTPESYGPASETADLTHWSFQGVVRPSSADSIDGFIRSKLTASGLTPSPQADRRDRQPGDGRVTRGFAHSHHAARDRRAEL